MRNQQILWYSKNRCGFNKAMRTSALFVSLIGFSAGHPAAAQADPRATFPAPLERFLLVASEGLYVIEADGRPSWSYQPAPQGEQGMDDIIYDGWQLPSGNFLFSTHRYIREIDSEKRTVWEYRLKAPAEVKSGVPLPNGNVAALNSEEQAIVELERGTAKVVRRTQVLAAGDDHTRYMLMRRTPEGNYLVALRAENRFVEVTPAGEVVHSFQTPAGEKVHPFDLTRLPVMAQRLRDGSTACTGFFGVIKLDRGWNNHWWFTHADSRPHFPMLYTWGVTEAPDGRLIVTNADWHLPAKELNRVQAFAVDAQKNISWMLPESAYHGWKLSETEPRTGLIEHRTALLQPLAIIPPARL